MSEFSGAASFGRCVAADVSADGVSASFVCGQIIYFRPNLLESAVVLVSKTPGGDLPNRGSFAPQLSETGGEIVYASGASNIVEDDSNDNPALSGIGGTDVFIYDLESDSNRRIAFDRLGEEVPFPGVTYRGVTPDLGIVLLNSNRDMGFVSDTDGEDDAFVLDRGSGVLETIPPVEGQSTALPVNAFGMSTDGSLVFVRTENNGLADEDANNREDLLVYDRSSGTYEIGLRRHDGELLTSSDGQVLDIGRVRGSGRFLVYTFVGGGLVENVSTALPQVYLTDRELRTNTLVTLNPAGDPSNGEAYHPQVSEDGRFVVFGSDASDLIEGDTNNLSDVFVKQMNTGRMLAASRGPNGELSDGPSSGIEFVWELALSDNGRYLLFPSSGSNLSPLANGVTQVYQVDVQAIFSGLLAVAVPSQSRLILTFLAAAICLLGSYHLHSGATSEKSHCG